MKMNLAFQVGDVIQNIDSYDGEPAMRITKIDVARQEYYCTTMCELQVQSIEDEDDMDCYVKIG